MNQEQLNLLIDKYFEGETSLEEEQLLKRYLAENEPITPEQKQVASLFAFYRQEVQLEPKHINTSAKQSGGSAHTNKFTRLAWAASVLICLSLGGWYAYHNHKANQARVAARERLYKDHFDEPEKALAEVKAALALVSKKMNKGKQLTRKNLRQVERLAIVK
jgi:hypothetical protein